MQAKLVFAEIREACRDFFCSEPDRLLVFSLDSARNFIVSKSFPPPRDRELGGIYFLKVSSSKITRDNLPDTIVTHDLPPFTLSPLELLMLFAKEAYFPLLTSAKNQARAKPPPHLHSVGGNLLLS